MRENPIWSIIFLKSYANPFSTSKLALKCFGFIRPKCKYFLQKIIVSFIYKAQYFKPYISYNQTQTIKSDIAGLS